MLGMGPSGRLATSICASLLMEYSASVPERGFPETEVNENTPPLINPWEKRGPVSHTHAAYYLGSQALPGEWLRAVTRARFTQVVSNSPG